jgi:nucleoid-associated protein YgaU
VAPPPAPATRTPKPAAAAAAHPLPSHETYVVRDNDSLWSIARKVYGNGAEWTKIVAANPGLTPQKLYVGMKLRLPDPAIVGSHGGAHAAATAAAAARPAATHLRPRSVTVQEGDTLYNIARKVYGDGEKWDVIYNANKDKLNNPDELPAGTQLTIPAS